MVMTKEKFVLTWRIVALSLLSVLTVASSIGAFFFVKVYDMVDYSFRQNVTQEIENREIKRINDIQDAIFITQKEAIHDQSKDIAKNLNRIVRLETILNREFDYEFEHDDNSN